MTTTTTPTPPPTKKPHVAVIVLGDVGRSPRMQYHAISLLQNNYRVTLVGYCGENLCPTLATAAATSDLTVLRFDLPTPPALLRRVAKPIYLLLRLCGMIAALIRTLWFALDRDVDCLLVQNPPSVPLLFLSYLYVRTNGRRRRRRTGLVIDWHNLGYSMFDARWMRGVARRYEMVCAPFADAHLCVTGAMKRYLEDEFGLESETMTVLRDRPPDFFRALSTGEKHDFLTLRGEEFDVCFP
eukprot:CAMPEP_0172514152 /NCGR_PEP_ID=MMETSP1066-20121228/257756_1 /TAXON_ID=671091 /ORGANISM="Coscinodiscus wailesii, Strain CCMP2513" /LENGTH=240 /DNA_ID=CAMNT_0013294697 /DNA_START=68 /DNA_END=786 /DNA_ORIENTATION=-